MTTSDDEQVTEEDVARLTGIFHAAARGEIEVPPYAVTTDPADNGFVVVIPDHVTKEGRTAIAGDVRRRCLADDGADPFVDIRVPWCPPPVVR